MIVRPPVDSAYGTDSNRTASRSTASPSTGTTGTIATSVGNGVVLNSTAIHVHEVPVDCGGKSLMAPNQGFWGYFLDMLCIDEKIFMRKLLRSLKLLNFIY